MKWACKNTLGGYKYTIDIENLLSPVYHLILDLIRERYPNLQFHEWGGEVFDIKKITGQIQVADDVSEESFLVLLSGYLEDYLYEQSNLLENIGVLLLYRTKRFFIAQAKTKMQPLLINWIKKSGIIDNFFELINSLEINNIREPLAKLMNDQYFGNSIKITELDLKGSFIPKKIIEKYEELPIDEEAIWLCDNWKTKIGLEETSQYNEVSFPNIDSFGIAMGDWVLPTEYVDHIVKSEYSTEYFWIMLNDVYAHRNNRISKYRDKCSRFANALRETEFANLMTKLRYNLYLSKDDMEKHEEFKEFFEEVYNIERFKKEINHVLFTGSHVAEQVGNKQTMFGLYKTVKDNTEFNLRAWINVETDNSQRLTTSNGEEKVEIKTVYALKPYYSYYFCKDYFEDMFEDMLTESGITSLSNFELYKSDDPKNCFIEIDKMVKKTDGSLVYIETKTTLNRYNIEDTLNEVVKFHQIMINSYPNVQMKYLLVSLYYNETVEDGFSYFTNAEGSSVKDFKIPIARYNGIDLHCIVEPEYAKLKTKMEQLLK